MVGLNKQGEPKEILISPRKRVGEDAILVGASKKLKTKKMDS